jgi:RNase H-fold protein (predicted Holliday junction resolvase)
MSNETESDIRNQVSDCFNANHGFTDEIGSTKSAYQMLTDVFKKYDLDHWDVDSLANTIEHVVAEYIMDYSPKFTDNDE